MSMHSDHHTDYFASSFDGAMWPAVLVFAGTIGLAVAAWMMH